MLKIDRSGKISFSLKSINLVNQNLYALGCKDMERRGQSQIYSRISFLQYEIILQIIIEDYPPVIFLFAKGEVRREHPLRMLPLSCYIQLVVAQGDCPPVS
jgi:hypothetical protein